MQLARFGLTQEQWREHVKELFVWVHEQYAERQGKPRWADKTPGYALILDYVDSLFPDCQVIHVIRDPRDVLDSWVRRWGFAQGRYAVPRVAPPREIGARLGCQERTRPLLRDPLRGARERSREDDEGADRLAGRALGG